jgi:hypothetical protein
MFAIWAKIGCWLQGCDFGRPWATGDFLPAAPAARAHSAFVHPVQLYEAWGALALCGYLLFAYPRRAVAGQIFSGVIAGYGFLRACTEPFHGDLGPGLLGVNLGLSRLFELNFGVLAVALASAGILGTALRKLGTPAFLAGVVVLVGLSRLVPSHRVQLSVGQLLAWASMLLGGCLWRKRAPIGHALISEVLRS